MTIKGEDDTEVANEAEREPNVVTNHTAQDLKRHVVTTGSDNASPEAKWRTDKYHAREDLEGRICRLLRVTTEDNVRNQDCHIPKVSDYLEIEQRTGDDITGVDPDPKM